MTDVTSAPSVSPAESESVSVSVSENSDESDAVRRAESRLAVPALNGLGFPEPSSDRTPTAEVRRALRS